MTCQWPDKHRHPTRDHAERAIHGLERADKNAQDMTAYRCGDHWHIGHDVKKFTTRIRRSLAGTPKPKRRK